MSGIGPSELIVLVVVGLLILGPERLPRVATQIGRWVGRARRTANQLRYQLEREITLADIEGKKKDKDKDRKPNKPVDQSKDKTAATDSGESASSQSEESPVQANSESEPDVESADAADDDSK